MFRYSLVVSLTVFILFIIDKRLAAGECKTDSDCSKQSKESPYCCKTSSATWAPRACYSSCAGKACGLDSDCGGTGGECCNTVNNKCTTQKSCLKKCYSNSECAKGTYCCKQVSPDPSVCGSSCVGKSCNFNSDCGGPGECCTSGGECTKVGCNGSGVPGWLIAVFSIVGVLVVVGLVILIWYFVRSSTRTTQRDPLLNRPSHSTNFA